MGRAVFPPCYVIRGQTMVEVMKIMVTSFKRSHASTAALGDPDPASRPRPTPASAGDSWTLTGKSGSVSCGSLLLSPGSWCAQGFVCALQDSVTPVLCKFWQLYSWLIVTFPQQVYAIPRSAAPTAPAAGRGLCASVTSPVPTAWFSGCATRAPSQICHMSPLES